MKKFLVSALLILTFGFYVFQRMTSGKHNTPPSPVSTSSPADSPKISLQANETTLQPPPSASSASPPVSASPTSKSAQSTPRSGYKDGTYTGSVADAFYGPLQARVVISRGKISDVQFLQYPNDRRTSQEISAQALPALKTEAIQTQNAQVDIVSGATQTSEAFQQSLQSALDQAKIS